MAFIHLPEGTFCCRILDYFKDTQTCIVSIGDVIIEDIPFDVMTPIKMSHLPWND